VEDSSNRIRSQWNSLLFQANGSGAELISVIRSAANGKDLLAAGIPAELRGHIWVVSFVVVGVFLKEMSENW